MLADGSAAYVTSVEATGVTEPVYNFSVEGWHTYHVGALGVWVHNVCFNQFERAYPASGLSKGGFDALAGRLSAGGAPLRLNEIAGAARYESRFPGRLLEGGSQDGVDWVYRNADGAEISVEHLGSLDGGALSRVNRRPEEFARSIAEHVRKGANEIVIDVTGIDRAHFPRFDQAVTDGMARYIRPERPAPVVTWFGR